MDPVCTRLHANGNEWVASFARRGHTTVLVTIFEFESVGRQSRIGRTPIRVVPVFSEYYTRIQ